jgi:tRNA(Arg) A34 adenosine deaminase TadA
MTEPSCAAIVAGAAEEEYVMVTLNEQDDRLLREAIAVSQRSRDNGNHPFGALLADENGDVILEAENSVPSTGDVTGHAETNLIRMATTTLSPEVIAKATMYVSGESCAMCAGAIYWGGINRLVYAMAETDLLALTGAHPENPTMTLPCRAVFESGQREIEVIGPALVEESLAVHEGFWDQ